MIFYHIRILEFLCCRSISSLFHYICIHTFICFSARRHWWVWSRILVVFSHNCISIFINFIFNTFSNSIKLSWFSLRLWELLHSIKFFSETCGLYFLFLLFIFLKLCCWHMYACYLILYFSLLSQWQGLAKCSLQIHMITAFIACILWAHVC